MLCPWVSTQSSSRHILSAWGPPCNLSSYLTHPVQCYHWLFQVKRYVQQRTKPNVSTQIEFWTYHIKLGSEVILADQYAPCWLLYLLVDFGMHRLCKSRSAPVEVAAFLTCGVTGCHIWGCGARTLFLGVDCAFWGWQILDVNVCYTVNTCCYLL